MSLTNPQSFKPEREKQKGIRSYHMIYETLKREIMLGSIEPGEALPEVILGTRFGASRAPVREALIHLHKDGFLNASDYRGFTVPEFSAQELKELYQVRLLIEPAAAEMAAQNPDLLEQKLPRLESSVELQGPDSPLLGSLPEQLDAEIAFHTLIAEASGSRLLASMVQQVTEQFQRYHVWVLKKGPQLSVTFKWHSQILSEIKEGRAEAAKQSMYSHIESARNIWVQEYFK